jgi:RIO-like serine/threonine protein kinase
VLHGDVRKENILVRNDKSIVIVDFDRTDIDNVSEEVIDKEDRDVEALLRSLRG